MPRLDGTPGGPLTQAHFAGFISNPSHVLWRTHKAHISMAYIPCDSDGQPLNLGARSTTASLSAENTWCDPLEVRGYVSTLVNGTWAGTLTTQRRVNGGAWMDISTTTGNVAYGTGLGGEYLANVEWRIGFKTGDYTSGTAEVSIAQ